MADDGRLSSSGLRLQGRGARIPKLQAGLIGLGLSRHSGSLYTSGLVFEIRMRCWLTTATKYIAATSSSASRLQTPPNLFRHPSRALPVPRICRTLSTVSRPQWFNLRRCPGSTGSRPADNHKHSSIDWPFTGCPNYKQAPSYK